MYSSFNTPALSCKGRHTTKSPASNSKEARGALTARQPREASCINVVDAQLVSHNDSAGGLAAARANPKAPAARTAAPA